VLLAVEQDASELIGYFHDTRNPIMTGIDYFFNTRLLGRDDHPRGEDKYVYDYEFLHCSVLHILCKHSRQCAKNLLGLDFVPNHNRICHQPEGGLFDLLFDIDDKISVYCEMKAWESLKESQLDRQIDFLKSRRDFTPSAIGLHILLSKPETEWSPEDFLSKSHGLSRRVTTDDMISWVASYSPDESAHALDVGDIAAAYSKALTGLKGRY